MNVIPYGRQSINQDDINAVIDVLKSHWITQGPKIDEFEKALASYCGAQYAVVVANGTAALHLACLAADLEKGHEVITSPLTFLATANAVLYADARPVFVDINPVTLNIDPREIQKRITKKTKAILPVHFAGLPADMAVIQKIAKKNKLIMIEDAAHALGAQYKVGSAWFKVGSCAHADMAIFSFHPVKHITTGEGGAITTNNPKLYERLKILRSHGMIKDQKTQRQGPWVYEMRTLGFNYRLTDLQCALGISQLKRLDQFVQRRREIAQRYSEAFKGIKNIECFAEPNSYRSSYHLYAIKINFKQLKTTRAALMDQLKAKGVGTQVHYIPIYRQPFYKQLGYRQNACPHIEKYYEQALSIPMYPDLSNQEQEYVIKTIKEIL